MKTIVVAGSLLLASGSALAMSCDNPRSAYDMTYCAALEMVQSDRELNDQYKKTMGTLNADQKKTLKSAQIGWLKVRDNACAEDSTLLLGCVNEKMAARIDLLKRIERECSNAGCDSAQLSRIE